MDKLTLTKKYDTYPRYKDSGIEWAQKMPQEWNATFLRAVAQENRKKNKDGSNQNLLSLSYGKIITKDINGVGGLLPESFNTYQVVQKGDIVMRLTDLQNDKKSLRVGIVDEEDGIITSAYLGLKFSPNIDRKFAYYILHSYDLQKVFYNLGGGVRQVLDYKSLKYLPILFPDIDLQKRIVAFLDKKITVIDSVILKKKKQIELLREKRSVLINHAVTKGLHPKAKLVVSGVEWIGEIPEGWMVQKIKPLITSITSGVWGNEKQDDENDIKCLRVADFDYEYLYVVEPETIRNNPGLSKNKILRKGDILFEKSGGGEKSPVGRAVIYNRDEQVTCANFVDIIRTDQNQLLPEYLVIYLSVLYEGRLNTKYIKQNTGIQNIKASSYFNEPIVLPSITQQREIIKYVDQLMKRDQKIKAGLQKSIDLLSEFKSSLISHAVTGKIRI